MTTSFQIDSNPPRVRAHTPGGVVDLPALWLRERSQDSSHLDARTRQRLFDPHQLPDDLRLVSAQAIDSRHVQLGFSDQYAGTFDLEAIAGDLAPADHLPERIAWSGALDLARVRLDWTGLGTSAALRAAAECFLVHGFIVLDNVPTQSESILEVASAFGHVRETNFGRYFEVYSRPDSNDLAYRPVHLGPHTDNPYREPVPGIQLLHCLTNGTTGGLSTLVDSLSVIEQLRREDPEGIRLLAETPVQFRFIDQDTELAEHRTIIQHDAMQRITGVHYSPRLDYLPLMPETQMRRFQRARRRLGELFVDSRYEIRFRLDDGQLMMFDNARILHGRTSFDPGEGYRHLQGCYIDIDGPRSLYRRIGGG